MKLYDKSGYVETLEHARDGVYTSATGLVWKEDASYRVEAEAPGLPKAVTDLEAMPDPPVVLSYDFSRNIDSRSNAGTPSRELILKIQDNDSGKSNYYMVVIDRVVGKETIGVNVFDMDKPSDFEDPCEFRYFGRFVFPDFCKVDGILTLRKGLELTYLSGGNFDPKARDRIVVSTRQISKSYYEFCRTYYDEDDLVVAFKTPYPRYTNITGGYGIFAAYNEVEKEFVLKE